MIWINKKDIPDILVKHQTVWTGNLIDAVDTHKGYNKIPKKLKEKLTAHYRHEDIQKALFENGNNTASQKSGYRFN